MPPRSIHWAAQVAHARALPLQMTHPVGVALVLQQAALVRAVDLIRQHVQQHLQARQGGTWVF